METLKSTDQETSKRTFKVQIKQIETYCDIVEVEASCEDEAVAKVEVQFTLESLADMKNTYEGTETEVEVVQREPGIYTVEELFNLDEEQCDQCVIKVDDLTDTQKRSLGLPVNRPRSIVVVSTYDSLRVNYYTGKVIECKSISKQELNLDQIDYFDLEEYRKYFDQDLPDTIELYKLGYWTTAGEYSAPENDH